MTIWQKLAEFGRTQAVTGLPPHWDPVEHGVALHMHFMQCATDDGTVVARLMPHHRHSLLSCPNRSLFYAAAEKFLQDAS